MAEDGVAAVALKLPTFWTKNPDVWFLQVEAQFGLRKITDDDTKYHYVVAALDQNTAASILHVLNNPPTTEKYQDLKDKLTVKCSLTEAERAARLCSMPGIGDGTATQLMDSMLALYPAGKSPDFIFRHLFVSQLPSEVRAQLTEDVSATADDFRKLAKKADGILAAQGFELTSTVHKQHFPAPESGACFYHAKFGKKAKKCQPPCTYVASGNGKAGRQ